MAPQTWTNYARVIGSVFTLAVKRGFLPANPLAGLDRPKITRKAPPILSPGQLAAFLAAASPALRPVLVLQAFCNSRGGAATCPPLLWTLETESAPDGDRLTVQCERHSGVDALVDLVKNGLTSARDIAAELDVTPGTVSKWAKKAEGTGRIRIEGRQYLPAA